MKKNYMLIYVMAVVMLIFITGSFLGCNAENEDEEFIYRRVIMIGVDGMGHNESIEYTPNIHKIFAGGGNHS